MAVQWFALILSLMTNYIKNIKCFLPSYLKCRISLKLKQCLCKYSRSHSKAQIGLFVNPSVTSFNGVNCTVSLQKYIFS